jgi:uncharacterized protein YceK
MKKTIVASISATVIAFAALLATSGCSTVVPIETNSQMIKYQRGSLATDLDASLDEVEKVVRTVLKNDLKFEVVSIREDNLCAEYKAKTAFNERILIRLDRKTSEVTTIDIRVGFSGDEQKSLEIFNTINARL